MAESVLWPTCRLLIIDCHERHVGPFGPSTNVVCQLCPGNSLCMLLESVASWPRTIAPRAEGKLYRATPPFGRMKTYFYTPTALCTQTCSWPADIFRFFAGLHFISTSCHAFSLSADRRACNFTILARNKKKEIQMRTSRKTFVRTHWGQDSNSRSDSQLFVFNHFYGPGRVPSKLSKHVGKLHLNFCCTLFYWR